MKKQLIILIGNIGAGKSTYVKNLVKEGYYVISKDALRYMVSGGLYIFDEEFERTIHTLSLQILSTLMYHNCNIVIDETNMSKEDRKDYLNYSKRYDYENVAVIFPKLSKEESVKRRLQSNHGDTPEAVWKEVWERKNTEYEEPTNEEGFGAIIRLTDKEDNSNNE